MTHACISTEELALLLDGELTENRARLVRDHLAKCRACSRELESLATLVHALAEPVAPLPGALERLLARLDEAPAAPPRPRWRPALVGSMALVAAAATIAVAPKIPGRMENPSMVIARGGPAERSLARDVGVSVYRGSSPFAPLRPGDQVRPDTSYAVAAVNLGANDSAYLMVFAEDSVRDLHWIEPAWLDPAQDPAGIPLAHVEREAPPSSAVVLDRPAPGALRVFVLVTPRPVHVSEIEGLPRATLDAAGLRARWPDGVVDETVARVASDEDGAR